MGTNQSPTVTIVIVTSESCIKILPVVTAIVQQCRSDDRLIVLSGGSSADDIRRTLSAGVERVFVRPRGDVFTLRAMLPTVVEGTDWAVLLEDHNAVSNDWLERLHSVLEIVPPEICAVQGTIDNLTSTSPWSWASFLHTFAFYWHPRIAKPIQPIIANIAFKPSVVGGRAIPIGSFETNTLREFRSACLASNVFPVNHVQHCGALAASRMHFHNGKVTGYLFSHGGKDKFWLRQHIIGLLTVRFVMLRRIINEHPSLALLPTGTVARLYWLACCHAAGAFVGALFGVGRSAAKVE